MPRPHGSASFRSLRRLSIAGAVLAAVLAMLMVGGLLAWSESRGMSMVYAALLAISLFTCWRNIRSIRVMGRYEQRYGPKA